MNPPAGGGKAQVRTESLRFFNALGVVDPGKVFTLGRLLHTLHEMAYQLEKHHASVGATLHAALSRMSEADNPTAAPQHRWIRAIDRLGFFSATEQRAWRVVNIGLSYAYRHKVLDILTAANALRLGNTLPGTRNDGSLSATPPPEVVPLGGIDVSRPGGQHEPAGGRLDPLTFGGLVVAGPLLPGASGGGGAAPGAVADGDGSVLVPPGGLVIARPGAVGAAGATAADIAVEGRDKEGRIGDQPGRPPADVDEMEVQYGGIAAARSSPPAAGHATSGGVAPDGASAANGVGLGVDAVDGVVPKIVLTAQHVITPTAAAVSCVLAVLEGLMGRADVREVRPKIVGDSLVCLTRLDGTSVPNRSSGADPASMELVWTSVRNHIYRWWPIWRAPDTEPAPVPVPGTVGFISHPTRKGRASRWALDVYMSGVNATIKRLPDTSTVLGGLPSVVTVTSVWATVRSPLPLSFATLLPVASKERRF